MKNWFQAFAFKCNLYCYGVVNVGQRPTFADGDGVTVGAVHLLNAVDP